MRFEVKIFCPFVKCLNNGKLTTHELHFSKRKRKNIHNALYSVYIDFDVKSIRSIAKLPSYRLTLNGLTECEIFRRMNVCSEL